MNASICTGPTTPQWICSGHGVCDRGRCACDEGYVLKFCEAHMKDFAGYAAWRAVFLSAFAVFFVLSTWRTLAVLAAKRARDRAARRMGLPAAWGVRCCDAQIKLLATLTVSGLCRTALFVDPIGAEGVLPARGEFAAYLIGTTAALASVSLLVRIFVHIQARFNSRTKRHLRLFDAVIAAMQLLSLGCLLLLLLPNPEWRIVDFVYGVLATIYALMLVAGVSLYSVKTLQEVVHNEDLASAGQAFVISGLRRLRVIRVMQICAIVDVALLIPYAFSGPKYIDPSFYISFNCAFRSLDLFVLFGILYITGRAPATIMPDRTVLAPRQGGRAAFQKADVSHIPAPSTKQAAFRGPSPLLVPPRPKSARSHHHLWSASSSPRRVLVGESTNLNEAAPNATPPATCDVATRMSVPPDVPPSLPPADEAAAAAAAPAPPSTCGAPGGLHAGGSGTTLASAAHFGRKLVAAQVSRSPSRPRSTSAARAPSV